jgi:hypothetical protein
MSGALAADARLRALLPSGLRQWAGAEVIANRSAEETQPDHNGVPPAIGIGERGDQGRCLGAACPRQRAALPDVEEGGHDPPVPGHQRSRLRLLPCQGCHRVLMIFRGHPAVEGEPQQALSRIVFPAPAGAPCPDRQHIAAAGQASRMSQMSSGHASTSAGTAGPRDPGSGHHRDVS